LQGFNTSLVNDSKKIIFIPCNFHLGNYGLSNPKYARHEAGAMLEYMFPQGKFRRHDPFGIVSKHCDMVSLTSPYSHK
jgi:hypothetical protein